MPDRVPVAVAVLISGTGSNLAALLEAAKEPGSPFRIAGVVADVDAPGLEHARRAGIPAVIVRPADHPDRARWDRALACHVAALSPDLVVLAGFMRIIGAPLLAAHPGRIINTHPSLLPSFPGAHAVQDALRHGVKVTGASVIRVDAGVDTGPILAQRAIDVLPDEDEDSLHERIKHIERRMLVDVVRSLTTSPVPTSPAPHLPGGEK